MPSPLFVKYRTKSNRNYLYDCGTGRILEVDGTIHALIDDYHVLPDEAVSAKYAHLGRERVRSALNELDELQRRGHLIDHEPTELSRIETILNGKTLRPLGDFWRTTGSLLILGLTERCNLDCSYCCFSGKFAGNRSHGPRSMAPETAMKAIADFINSDQAEPGKCSLTFYGGEPLLEFHLLRECVRFAENHAAKSGKTPSFAITTNGTLLDDEAVDFLVEHDFMTLISLDGAKRSHDRYRVFPDGKGSHDLLMKNLRRMVERYPDVRKRGLNVTLAPPLEWRETEAFLGELAPHFPLIRASLVHRGAEYRFDANERPVTQYGCSASCSACSQGTAVDDEAFRRFDEAEVLKLKTLWKSCRESLVENGMAGTWETMPLAMSIFGPQLEMIHGRPITPNPPEWTFFVPCLPGFSRRFVDVEGNYRVCERVDDAEAYIVGNVRDGLDPDRMERTMELRRHFGDCGNCSALKTCDTCYARIPDSDGIESGFDPQYDMQCRQIRESRKHLLQAYTEIMEENPAAFPRTAAPSPGTPAFRFGVSETALDETTQHALFLETFPLS